ncbi:MAG: hypothetical protein LQ348_006416 [Seirophora lacunosa]|nr:MAG: hypothetical protein LQ348_006416 [Seirophora lacunosa]
MNKQETREDAGNQSHPGTDFQGRPCWSPQKPSRTSRQRLRQRTAKTQRPELARNPTTPVLQKDIARELARIEHGAYEEVKELLSASARKLALEKRQAQTLQQLERMQDEQPEMLRIRRRVELDSSTPPLAELPGSTIDITTLLRPSRPRHESRLGPLGQIEDSRRHSWSGL